MSVPISNYVTYGTHAARPASPTVQTGEASVYVETDTNNIYVWNGSAWVLTGSTSLANDSDVSLSSPSDGQVLTYQAASSKWINAAATGGGANPTNITFGTTVTGTTFNPNAVGNTSYWASNSTITLPAAPFVFKARVMIKINSATSGYTGMAIGNGSGTGNVFYVGTQNSSGGYVIAYNTPLSGAGSVLNGYYSMSFDTTNALLVFEMSIHVVSSALAYFTAAYGSYGSLGQSDTTADLTSMKAYAVGAASTDVVKAQYLTYTTSSSSLF